MHVKKYPKRYKLKTEIINFYRTFEEMKQAEILYIMAGKIKYKHLCMNLANGGENGNAHPLTKAKSSKHAKKLWATKGHKERVISSLLKTNSLPEVKERHRRASTIMNSDLNYKRKQRASIIKTLNTPEIKKKHIEGIKRGRRAHLTIWNYEKELYEIWKENKTLGKRTFKKLAVSLGYPDEPYDGMIYEFKNREVKI